MPRKYKQAWIDRIVSLAQEGLPVRVIQKCLEAAGLHMDKKSVWYYARGHQRARRPIKTKTTEHVRKLVDKLTRENDFSAVDIKKVLKTQHNIELSASSIRVLRRQLGRTFRRNRIYPLIRESNKDRRVAQARAWIESQEQFNDVIFTGEMSVALESSSPGDKAPDRPERPAKVLVWATISRNGPGPIVIFEGKMDKDFFQNEIVVPTLAPYIRKCWPSGHRLFQDNDPKHNASAAFLLENQINWVRTPPQSPDLNPLGMVWPLMTRYIRKVERPESRGELVEAIENFWYKQLKKETCNELIERLIKVLPAVIERKGLAAHV